LLKTFLGIASGSAASPLPTSTPSVATLTVVREFPLLTILS
jgi:hypothetical protein